MRLVDLSQEIFDGMPVYPSHQRTSLFVVKSHPECLKVNGSGFSSHTMGILMSDHGPTHVDAHSHLREGAPTIDKMPIEDFYGQGICLDVSHITGEENYITVDEIRKALDKAKLDIRSRDTVLVYTGHYNRHYPDYGAYLFNYSGLNTDSMNWIFDQGAINIGVDSPSVDSSIEMKKKDYPCHVVCRERHLMNTENMANLDKVAGKRFTLIMFPLKIRGGSASPIRPVAVLE
jgi:kynurenine formamidase